MIWKKLDVDAKTNREGFLANKLKLRIGIIFVLSQKGSLEYNLQKFLGDLKHPLETTLLLAIGPSE